MVGLHISIPWIIAIPLAVLGAVWIYRDAQDRGMDTADMWAVGFGIGFFIPPLIGGLLVFAFYLQKRTPRRGQPHAVPSE